ncbi:MAG: SLC13 family permease [Bacteroidetes bacterium]|jgi:di/tricarboxylate transporter|nr:SLC13 family permease [Bacteroidota bacterium]
MLSLEGYIVIAVILFLVISLYFNKIGPGFTFMIGIAILGIFRVITPAEILAGFANEQIAVVIMLLLLGDIIRRSGVLDRLFEKTFANTHTYKGFMMRMTMMVAGFSAFLNNTPLVAIMMPYVSSWSKKNNIAPSKLLIPLSYAAILGGGATLIGTSTNMVVAGMVTDQYMVEGLEPLEIFDFSLVGVPMILFGIAYLLIFGNRLLPDKIHAIEALESQNREYIAEVRIVNGLDYEGKTIAASGLLNMKGLFLLEILRNGQSIQPVLPSTQLQKEDILLFAGETESITEMVASRSGLQLAQLGMYAKKAQTDIIEVVVSYNSTLISKTAREANFRAKFDAAIIAIHRNGEHISGKLGNVKLAAGDALLLVAGQDFAQRAIDSHDFYVISKIRELKKQPFYKQFVLIGGTMIAIIAAAIGLVKLFTAILALVLLVTLINMVSPKDIAKSIDFNLLLIIALSLALGTAMIKSGVAAVFADFAFGLFKPFGIVGVLVGIFAITNLLGSFITNKAAVALIFPIAVSMALELGINPKPFILTVAFAGAASFLTPIGYQTNLMVYGPGGYTFKDFFKIGFPLSIIYMIVTVLGLVYQYDISLY